MKAPSYDDDGNLIHGVLPADVASQSDAQLAWDGENRLIKVIKASGTIINFSYDCLSRRISKQVDGSPKIHYIYDAWNMIADYQIQNSTFTIQNSYLWGTDLSGSMQGAGGVGGLLQVTDHVSSTADHYYPTYDGNGNISEYLDNTGTAVAHYEYSPFGRIVASTGAKAADFEHKFSTKLQDVETGLYYYGYRYYDPVTGRWPSRDPIGELGGFNLYGMISNDLLNYIDYLGLISCDEAGCAFKKVISLLQNF